MHTHVSAGLIGGNPAYIVSGVIPTRIQDVWGATFLKASNRWVMPAFRPVHTRTIEDLQKVVDRERHKLVIDPTVTDYLKVADKFEDLPSDFTFVTQPFKHQREGLLWAYNLPRAGLFYDPGLGKCKITVDLYRLTKVPMLILCPAVVLKTWAREFQTHGNIDDVIVVAGSKKERHAALDKAIERTPAALVITYESAVLYANQLLQTRYGYLVMDESHRVKEITSVRTKAALMLSERRPRRLLLSGTPTVGNPFSMYAQFRALGPYFASESWPDFKKRYASFAPHNEYQVVGYRNMEQLNKRINEVCLRRTQEECLDLPELRVIDVPFELSSEQKQAYNEVIDTGGDALGAAEGFCAENNLLTIADGPVRPHHFVWASETVSKLSKLEQIVGGFVHTTNSNLGLCNGCDYLEPCIEDNIRPYTASCRVATKREVVARRFSNDARRAAAKELLTDILENPDNKCIVWTRFIAELETVTALAQELGVDYVVVRGGMKLEAFEAAMHRFNNVPTCRLYIGQVASGIGVTLNAANYMLYYSLPWSHEHYVQSRARFYRIGQKRKTTVYRLLGIGTTDYHKAAALDQKIEVEDMLTDADYTVSCPVHGESRGRARGTCRCDGSVDRIVANLERVQ